MAKSLVWASGWGAGGAFGAVAIGVLDTISGALAPGLLPECVLCMTKIVAGTAAQVHKATAIARVLRLELPVFGGETVATSPVGWPQWGQGAV